MRRARLTTLSIVMVATSLSAASDAPRILPPASKWNVDYAEDSCALRRAFGTGDHQVVWELRQFEPGNTFNVTAVAKGDFARVAGKVRAVFDPGTAIDRGDPDVRFVSYGDELHGFNYLTSLTGSDSNRDVVEVEGTRAAEKPSDDQLAKPAVIGGAAMSDSERDARERAITGFTVFKGFAEPVTLQTGELHQPMQAMRQCLDELVTHWGIDAAAQRSLSRGVKPVDQTSWARRLQEDYPSDALRKEQNGLVRVRMIVDPAGRPASCHVQMKAKDDIFERTACGKLMRYARFEPALDAEGKPVTSYFITTVVYLVR